MEKITLRLMKQLKAQLHAFTAAAAAAAKWSELEFS
jgi:hypothetical protein